MKRHFLSVCAALFALTVLCSVTAYATDNVYAILYDDGTLVFQHGDTPESGKNVTKTYEVDLNALYTGYQSDYAPWYNERESVRVVDFKDKISPSCMSHWFFNYGNLERVDNIQNLDTSKCTDVSWMFADCTGLTALDVSGFDTSNVTNMYAMFWNCPKLTELDVSGFKTSKVTDTQFMFGGCAALSILDVSGFDTSNVTSMHSMFQGCTGLKALNVSGFQTSKVTDMSWMFFQCESLTTLDVSRFNTANVTNMAEMFTYCHELTALDVSNFDTANVTSMHSTFNGCRSLTALDMSHFDTANVTDMICMFWGCSGLTMLNVSHFDTAKVTTMNAMFSGCSNLKTIYTSEKFITVSVLESVDMFKDCTSLVGGNGIKFDSNHTDKAYARIDTPSAPGYFTDIWDVVKSHIITAYVGEGGTVTPPGDCRVRAGDNQKYIMTPNPGYRVQSVRIDGVEIGALSEYVFQNVIRDHNIVVSFERLLQYAITAAAKSNGQLSVTLTNTAPVTVAVSYFDTNGKFLSANLKNVSADVGSVTFPLSAAHRARVALFDSDCRPLCDAVTVQ